MNPILAKGKILSNRPILEGGSLYEMNILIPEMASGALPGQFVQVDCGEGTSLRRPISICNADDVTLTLCYDVRGKGTLAMAKMPEGGEIDLLGPIGRGFEIPAEGRVLLVGGGIGIYPLVKPAAMLGGRAKALLGFRNAGLVNGAAYFTDCGVETAICTDDGSFGVHGFVTSLLEEELKAGAATVLICGPMPMMKAAAAVCAKYGAAAQVSLEERMGCGVGACLACVCKIKVKDGDGEKHARVCVDGPVFDASEVVW